MNNQPQDSELRQLKEKLAAIEHERWADWQTWMHSKMVTNDNTDKWYHLPKRYFKWWQKQIKTPYADLSEKEKDSDREQVDRYWPLIEALLQQSRSALLDEIEKILEDNNITEEMPVARTNSETESSYQPTLIQRSTINRLINVANSVRNLIASKRGEREK